MVACGAGTGDGHCCWIPPYGVCPLLRDDGPGAQRRWVCTARERLGSWEAVHADPEYRAKVGVTMLASTGVDCGDWPRPGEQCAECGAIGD